MSTTAEIEAAIAHLSPAELLASLDEAEAEIERGECFSTSEMRAAVRSWVGR